MADEEMTHYDSVVYGCGKEPSCDLWKDVDCLDCLNLMYRFCLYQLEEETNIPFIRHKNKWNYIWAVRLYWKLNGK